jgi:hypothetical protein
VSGKPRIWLTGGAGTLATATPAIMAMPATKAIKDRFFILSFLLLLIVLVCVWLAVVFLHPLSLVIRWGSL